MKCEADHDLGYELLNRFAYMVEQRLDATRLQLLDVYGAPTHLRAVLRHGLPMVPAPFRVQRLQRETHDTFTLECGRPTKRFAFPFSAGNSIWCTSSEWAKSPFPSAAIPARQNRSSIPRAVGLVSPLWQAQAWRCGRNSRSLRGSLAAWRRQLERTSLLWQEVLACSLRPVIYRILSNRAKYNNVILLYGARSPQEILYLNELERWRSRFDMRSRSPSTGPQPHGRARWGVVTSLIPKVSYIPGKSWPWCAAPK